MSKALVIGTKASAEIEVVSEALVEMGFDVLAVFREDLVLVDSLKLFDLTVHLGSDQSLVGVAIQKQVRSEFELIESRVQSGFPVFGICYGAQLLARVLGGENYRCSRAEIGWVDILPERDYEAFGGRWFTWHYDGFTVPKHVKVVAENATGIQAFQGVRFAGVQFHPEVNTRVLCDWLETGGSKELEALGIAAESLWPGFGISDEEIQQRLGQFFLNVLDDIL